jgi:hypothetical protein
MKTSTRPDHRALAEAVRRRVPEGAGETLAELRQASARRAAGGAACRVTDAQVSNVLIAAGSEKAAFEIIAAAALGAELARWEQAMNVLDEATDAPAGN